MSIAWIFEIEHPDVTFESFSLDTSESLRTLDDKSAKALGEVVEGEKSRRCEVAIEEAAIAG